MAKHPLLLLLAVWVLPGGLWLEAETQGTPDKVKLCNRELVRAIIQICGSLRWGRSDILAHEATDAEPDADSKLDEAVAVSEWLTLTKSPQAFYGGPPNWQETPGALRGSRGVPASLLTQCCNLGCSKSELSMFFC